MRIPDACRFTGISRSTLYLLIARGEVEIVKLGAATLILTESLRDLIERQRGGHLSRTAISIQNRPVESSQRANFDHRPRSQDRHRSAAHNRSMPLFEEEQISFPDPNHRPLTD
ncbi:helix-turn-helix domain-containing protein [Sphingopyxis sp.]|jgi:excisionase family DNA binding protein|uniref:helix-turn-helix domain-containing protein n=1 Tax=Sphingopyxis sp. TaxID=1908224 RepID=UPI00344B011F